MKILVIQENGRHDKNRHLRECFSLQRSFEKLGHECHVWGLGHEWFMEHPVWESYDLILNIENYDEIGWVPNLKDVKTTKFLWSIDAHCGMEHVFNKTFIEGKYDKLLHSTKDFVKEDNHVWFPNAYDNNFIFPMNIQKENTFGFCGNFGNRKELILKLDRDFGMKLDIFVIGDDMVRAINSYRCHFNKNIANDINYRSFETIGCGTLLLTNYNPQYDELGFIHGENCFMYKNEDHLYEIMRELSEWNEDHDKIALSGLKLAEKHTYDERVKNLLEIKNRLEK